MSDPNPLATGPTKMNTKRDSKCSHCDGEGYILDYLGGCGDPECCGGPIEVRCLHCDNDWTPEDNDCAEATK